MSLANSESIINQEVVEQLTRNKPLSDEQYELSSTRSTADVLIVSAHTISEALEKLS